MNKLFEGHTVNYIECINVDYKSTRREPFMDVQVRPRRRARRRAAAAGLAQRPPLPRGPAGGGGLAPSCLVASASGTLGGWRPGSRRARVQPGATLHRGSPCCCPL